MAVSFFEHGYEESLARRIAEIQTLYLDPEFDLPWVCMTSSGKDSSASLLLVWQAIAGLPVERRSKRVYVLTSDTGVENPVIAQCAHTLHARLRAAIEEQAMPFEVHMLKPPVEETFWVKLIGRGYAAPTSTFRWCTTKLKINPADNFIKDVLERSGKAILFLGVRRSESASRKRSVDKHAAGEIRPRLAPSGANPNTLAYTPVVDFTTNDIWAYLLNANMTGWGIDSYGLYEIYSGATEEGECPLVVDKNSASCGKSRFGCWTCTLVEKDKSLTAMIENDPEQYAWMRPMLEFRNFLAKRPNHYLRDWRRSRRHPELYSSDPTRLTPGPYTQAAREMFLRKLLETQQQVRELGPDPNLELITTEELRLIRKTWLEHWREVEDRFPKIYLEVTGEVWIDEQENPLALFPLDLDLLRQCCEEQCEDDDADAALLYESLRNMLVAEQQTSRREIHGELEKVMAQTSYFNKEQALQVAQRRKFGPEASRRVLAQFKANPGAFEGDFADLFEQEYQEVLNEKIRLLPDDHPVRQPSLFGELVASVTVKAPRVLVGEEPDQPPPARTWKKIALPAQENLSLF